MSNSAKLFKFELLFDIFTYILITQNSVKISVLKYRLEEHHLSIKSQFRIVQITYGKENMCAYINKRLT